jgi:chromosome segregation ATPase
MFKAEDFKGMYTWPDVSAHKAAAARANAIHAERCPWADRAEINGKRAFELQDELERLRAENAELRTLAQTNIDISVAHVRDVTALRARVAELGAEKAAAEDVGGRLLSRAVEYNARLREAHEQLVTACQEKNERIDCLREALEWYASRENYRPAGLTGLLNAALHDEGHRARAALAGEKAAGEGASDVQG